MERNIRTIINDENIIMLTVDEVSKILRLGRSSTYKIVNRADCPFAVYKFDNSLRIEKKSLLEYLQKPITI